MQKASDGNRFWKLAVEAGRPSVSATVEALRPDFPDMRDGLLDVLVEDCISVAKGIEDRTIPVRDWEWSNLYFFPLVRRLKTRFTRDDRDGQGGRLAVLGLLYADLLSFYGVDLSDSDEADNRDAILIGFESAWDSVHFAEDETALTEAFERSKQWQVPIDGPVLLRRFFTFAVELQRINGKKPIFMPVSDGLAKMFGVSPKTIGKTIKVCVARELLTVVDGRHVPMQKARTFRVSSEYLK